MSEKRKPTKEDEFLRIRLMAGGTRYNVEGELQFSVTDRRVDPIIFFDDIDMGAETRPNPYASLEPIMEGNNVTVTEMGEVLCTAALEP